MEDMVHHYASHFRPTLECACEVWYKSIIQDEIHLLESIKKQDIKFIFKEKSYDEVLVIIHLPRLNNCKEQLRKSLFEKMQIP